MRPVVAAGFLFDAKGVCFLATATRLFGANDTVRLYSRWYSWDAWRPGETISDLLAATWVCVQAASEAAPRITASHCTTLRSPEPELKGAPMQIALMSTYEVLAQLLENISSPAYRIRHARVAIQSGRNEVRRELLRHHSRDFMSVLSLSHIRRLKAQIVPLWSDEHTLAQCRLRGMNDRSMVTKKFVAISSYGSTCVAIWLEPTLLRAKASGHFLEPSIPEPENDRQSHSSGDVFLALATPPAPVRWHRAILTPLASHPWPLRVRFRVAARQNRRRDRRVPARPHL